MRLEGWLVGLGLCLVSNLECYKLGHSVWETLLLANDSEKSSLLNDTVNIIFKYGIVTAICISCLQPVYIPRISVNNTYKNHISAMHFWGARRTPAGYAYYACAIDPRACYDKIRV